MLHKAFEAWRDSLATGEQIEEASEQFFRELREMARAVVWNTLRRHDPQLEADIVTMAFLRAKTFREMSSFGTWFYRLAYNQCLKDLRTKRRRKEVFLDDLLQEPVVPAKSGGEFIALLADLRSRLSREDLELIDQRLAGYSLPEIAEQRGWEGNRAAVEWRACRNRVRKLLTENVSQKDFGAT